jgi:hypothetical protein
VETEIREAAAAASSNRIFFDSFFLLLLQFFSCADALCCAGVVNAARWIGKRVYRQILSQRYI